MLLFTGNSNNKTKTSYRFLHSLPVNFTFIDPNHERSQNKMIACAQSPSALLDVPSHFQGCALLPF